MRLTRANIESYGQFSDQAFDIDPERIVVVYGPNEAGKTTFASFLTSMLFGFSPSKYDQHPYGKRSDSNRHLAGRLDFVSGDRRRCSIFRDLKSTPRSRYTSGEGLFGDEEDLRNRPIPGVDHINSRVFKSVYSLSLSEMQQIESRTWDFVQDRLLGGLSMDYLKPARVVIESLEQEAKQFWRADRRGKPVASEIEDSLRSLRQARREARDVDQRVRDLANTVEELSSTLSALKKERAELKYHQRVASRLRPVKTLRERIAELNEKAGDIDSLSDLPSDPIQKLRELRSRKNELQERKISLASSIREDSTTITSYKDNHELLRTLQDDIRSWGSRVGRHESSVAELEETNSQLTELVGRLKPAIDSVFGKIDPEDVLRRLAVVDQSALLGDIASIADSDTGRRTLRDLETQKRKHQITAVIIACIGFVSALLGLAFANTFMAGAGATAALLAIAYWISLRRSSETDDGRDHFREEAARRINANLSGLLINSERFLNGIADLRLVPDVQRICDGANEFNRMTSRRSRLAETVDDDRRRLSVLTSRLGTDNHAPPTVLIARMARDLEDANFRHQSAEKARQRTASLKVDLDRTSRAIEALEKQETVLVRELESFGDGDIKTGSNRIITRRRAHSHAEQLAETLEKDYPDWRELVEDRSILVHPDEKTTVSTELRLDEVEDKLQAVASNLASAREQMRHLEDSKPISDLDGEIEVANKDLVSAKIERDRRILLASILRQSEQRFRDQHQPDVIRKANEYLKIITSGRYNQLVLDDLTGALRLWSEEEKDYLDVEQPLSRGTLDQIYLAVRIAIIDHLDRNHEKLPVVLDEVLVNWDSKRRQRAYAILKKLALDRHVLMFTCHQWMVDEMTDVLDAQVITIN